MPSHIQMTMEKIRLLRAEADTLQESLNDDVQALIDAGLVASRSDEDPLKAISKLVVTLGVGNQISAASVKSKVPCARDLTHRGITAMLSALPLLTAIDGADGRDQFGLKQFRRIDLTPQIQIPVAAD